MSDEFPAGEISSTLQEAPAWPAQLAYTTDEHSWLRRHKRGLLVALLLIVFGLFGYHWGGPVYRQLRLHILEVRASRYRAPADHVVFHQVDVTGQPGQKVVAPGDQNLATDFHSPRPWFDFAQRANLPFGPIVFVGSRNAGKGARIVYLWQVGTYGMHGPLPAGAHKVCLSATILQPGGWTSPPIDLHAGAPPPGLVVFFPAKIVRVLAGQVDASDPAHFTVTFRLGDDDNKPGVDETVDFFLQSDDTVQITPRSTKLQTRVTTLLR